MKLKDKKIDIQGVRYVSDQYGNRRKETFTLATVWAYFRQLSGNEIYRVTTQATEEVMFIINYRTDITTEIFSLDYYEKYGIMYGYRCPTDWTTAKIRIKPMMVS